MTPEKKAQILNLITSQKFPEAFEVIRPHLEGKNDLLRNYNKLTNEFINPPNNFEIVNYGGRLSAFVATISSSNQSFAAPKPADEKLYDDLCEVNFDIQSVFFRNVYLSKDVSAFLLYGENENEMKWLYHQLLNQEQLIRDKPVSIDYTGNINTSFEQLSQLLYDKFSIKNQDRRILRSKIEQYLNSVPLVIIIKYPAKKLADLENFYQSFYDFFSYLHTEVAPSENKVIFLFVENSTTEYDSLNKEYFLWHNQVKAGQDYSLIAIGEKKPRVMDMAPIEKINPDMIKGWLRKRIYKPELQEISCDSAKCLALLNEGDSPYNVIQKLFDILKKDSSKTLDQWLIH